ncbi:MAG: hypothetical protein ACE5OZ_10905 [Candidatus Heimdallarchaeota archaeon]
MPKSPKQKDSMVSDTISLFSLINPLIEEIFVQGILSITDQQKADLKSASSKFKDLSLDKISSEINCLLDNLDEKKSLLNLMRLYTMTRLLERLYTRETLIKQLESMS